MNVTHLVKIVMAGDSRIGKSALCQKWNGNKYLSQYVCTIGVEFVSASQSKQPVSNFCISGQQNYPNIGLKHMFL